MKALQVMCNSIIDKVVGEAASSESLPSPPAYCYYITSKGSI